MSDKIIDKSFKILCQSGLARSWAFLLKFMHHIHLHIHLHVLITYDIKICSYNIFCFENSWVGSACNHAL